MQSTTHDMDRVSFTADGIAARRTIMGIPRSQNIYDVLLEKIAGTEGEVILREAMEPNNLFLVPFFESRYRLLDNLIKATGAKKILELAAGLAPRGINWTDNLEVEYVELDLPLKSDQKREMVETLVARSKIRTRLNLHFVGGDATNSDDLVKAASHFKEVGPIVIANEGLLRYLTFDQKRTLAENIRGLLERFGGYWITPDINLPDPMLQNKRIKEYAEKTQAKLGMNTDRNLFKSISAARAFFEDLGFEVAEHSFREVISEMVSPTYLNLPAHELEKLIGWRVAFVMKLKVF